MNKIFICILGFLMLTGCNAKDTVSQESSSMVEISAIKQDQNLFDSAPISEAESSEANSKVSENDETEVKSSLQSEVHESSKELPFKNNGISQQVDVSSSNSKDNSSQQSLNALKTERGINDLHDFDIAINVLDRQITDTLDDTLYGGVDQIMAEYTDEESNETKFIAIGIKIFYVNLDEVKPIVETCFKNIDSSVGKIEIEYVECKYSIHEMGKFASEIAAQSFFEESISFLTIDAGKIYVTISEKGNSKDLENFLSDKSYKDAVLIWVSPFRQWLNALKTKRGISDLNSFSAAIYNLNEKIKNSLDDTLYGGLGKIYAEYTDKKSNETMIQTIGVKIFYLNLDEVKPIVEECLKNIDGSVGKIEIEYAECKYSIHDLEKFESEIQAQPFYERNIIDLTIYGGQLHVTIAEKGNSKDLENFLNDKSYKDAILIKPQYTDYNPLC